MGSGKNLSWRLTAMGTGKINMGNDLEKLRSVAE